MSIGPIDDIGFVSLHASTKETLVQKVANLLWETSFLDTLQLAIARSSTKYAPQPISAELPYSGYQAPNGRRRRGDVDVETRCSPGSPPQHPESLYSNKRWIWKSTEAIPLERSKGAQ